MKTQQTKTNDRITVDQFIDTVVGEYKRSVDLNDEKCGRLARIAMCREIRERTHSFFTYRQASSLLV